MFQFTKNQMHFCACVCVVSYIPTDHFSFFSFYDRLVWSCWLCTCAHIHKNACFMNVMCVRVKLFSRIYINWNMCGKKLKQNEERKRTLSCVSANWTKSCFKIDLKQLVNDCFLFDCLLACVSSGKHFFH